MASKDSTPANTISSRGNGCISFDECMDIFKRGGACQMQYNGQWIPFDPNVVIRDFRIAPQLTQKDGAKIVRYALYRLGEILDQMCSGMYFALPQKGPEPPPIACEAPLPSMRGRCVHMAKLMAKVIINVS